MSKSTKEIAKEIKAELSKLPGVKLSVTTPHNQINISLMAAPWNPIENGQIVYKGYVNRDNEPKKFDGNYSVNHYYFNTDENLTVDAKIFFNLVDEIIKKYHWDKSDSQTDYFHCAFYYNYSVGQYNKPFVKK